MFYDPEAEVTVHMVLVIHYSKMMRSVQISKLAIPDSQISDCTWSRVAADLFRSNIVLVDYYSNFLEVRELLDALKRH